MHRRFSSSSLKSMRQWIQCIGSGMLVGGAFALPAQPAAAVQQLTVELGPAEVTVQVNDLAAFSRTGEVTSSLEPLRPWLTPTVQATLKNHLSVEPAIRDRIFQDLATSSNGRLVVGFLAKVAPSLSPETLQAAMQAAAATESGITAITLLEALPGESLTLQGKELLRVASQLGLSYLEQTALSRVLDNELEAVGGPILMKQFEPSISGGHPFERWSVSFRDHDRDRVIPMDLYWSENSRGPLDILSHGFGADRHFLAYLAEHLASHGLTVVALEHPGSNVEALIRDEGSLLPAQEFIARPKDISFLLDRLEELNQNSFFLRGRLNLENVTLVGHSLGGYTGLVLAGGQLDAAALANFCQDLDLGASSPAAWLQCAATEAELPSTSLADARISQLVVMNPLAGRIFGDKGLRQVKVPTLFLTSTSDGITSVSDQQLRPFNQLAGPRALIAVIGGTHLSVGDPANINPALTQVPFMPERPEEETLRLRQYLNGVVLSFVMQQTDQAKQYQSFLSADYARMFTTPEMPLRYSDRLPESVNRWLSSSAMMNHRLAPTLRSLASLLHLELIDAQYRIATLQQDAVAQFPISPLDLSAHLPRSSVFYRRAYRTASANQVNRESSRRAK